MAIFDRFWGVFGCFRAVLGCFGAVLGCFEVFWAVLNGLGLFWAVLNGLGLFWAKWSLLEPFGDITRNVVVWSHLCLYVIMPHELIFFSLWGYDS